MKMKKVLAVVLATVMTMSMVVGCGAKKDDAKDVTVAETEAKTEAAKETEAKDESVEADVTEVEETEEAIDFSNLDYDSPTYQKATEEVAGGNKVTINTVSMFGGTDPNAAAYNAMTDRFLEQHPNVTIEDDSTSADEQWKARVEADFSVGNEPDVLQFFTDSTVDNILTTEKLVSIEEIVAEYPEYAADSTELALKQVTNNDGVSRAIPTTGYWEGLFVNEDLFKANDIELPTDWASFVTAIEKLKEAGITPIAVSLNNVPHYWVEYLMLYAAGEDEYTSTPETAPESWVKGLETIKTLREMGAFPEDTDTIDEDMAIQLFNDKKAAMILDGNWRTGGITDQDNVKVIDFPGVEDQKAEAGTMISGISSGFYITKKAWDDPDKRDAAVKFVMAQTCKDALMKYWGGNGLATCDAEAIEGMTPLAKSGLEFSMAATGSVKPTDARINAEAYKQLIGEIVQVSTGDMDAKTVLDDILGLSAERSAD